jgi:polysaccharide export outer membrane protein
MGPPSFSIFRALGISLVLAAIAPVWGCASTGQYVWFTQLPPAERQSLEYLIETGDLLDIKVLGHDDMAVHQKVRGDGRISIPIIGDVEARGKRPSGLRGEIEGRLKDYIVSPSVTVNVDDTPMTITCLGEVGKPGAFPLEAGANLAHAIALAGGLTDFAARDRIFVVRQQPTPVRIRFDYEWVLRNEGGAAAFPLRRGDMLVVE